MPTLQLLLLARDGDQADRLRSTLRAAGLAEDETAASFDLAIADYRYLERLRFAPLAGLVARKVPVIVVSDVPGVEAAVASFRAGATHYLVESELERRLGEVVREVRNEALLQKEAAILDPHLSPDQAFREVAEVVPFVLWMTDPQGKVVYVNRGGRASRVPVEQGLGDGWMDTIHPEDRERCKRGFEEASRRLAPYQIECRVLDPDGSHQWLLVVGTPRLAGERFLGYAGYAIDVTDRKQAESDTRLRDRAIAAINEGLVITDPHLPDNPIIYTNPAFTRLTGYSAEEAIGRNCRMLQGPRTDPRAVARIRQSIESGHACTVELVNHRKDGQPFWNALSISPIHGPDGGIEHFVGVLGDVTARKEAEERASRLVAILDATPDFVGIAGMDGIVEYVNEGGRKLLGSGPSGEQPRRHIRDFHPRWAFDRIVEQGIPQALREGHWSGESALLDDQGQEHPVWQVVLAHRGPDGEPLYLSTIMRSQAEYRHLELQLRQAQKMEAIGRLAAGVAHDFNNLLTVISGYTELLLSGHLTDNGQRAGAPAAAPYLEQILKAGEQAASLTRQLLAFSRRSPSTLVVLDLGQLVKNLDKMLRRLVGEEITVTTSIATETAAIRADPGSLEQILLNLVVNARDAILQQKEERESSKAVPARISVELTAIEASAGPASRPPGVPGGRFVCLSVADTGCGMDEATKARIFEPFFTTKTEGKGTGLGLAMVYGAVRQTGGWIEVSSEVGRGTTFRIFLPRVDPAQSTPDTQQSFARLGGHESILVVEDEPDVRRLARESLRVHGFTVHEAGSADGAIKVLAELPGPVDLVLTDVVMPGVGGRELAERIARRWPSTRVVFMSGYTEDTVVRHGVRVGGIDFLQKPFTPLVLIRKVREVLDRPGKLRKEEGGRPRKEPTVPAPASFVLPSSCRERGE